MPEVSQERQAGETELTPAMVAAGAACLWGFDSQVDSAREKAAEIFREMLAARHQAPARAGLPRPLLDQLARESPCNPQRCTELIAETPPC